MPQASDELRAKFADDGEAWKLLESRGWRHEKSVLSPPCDAPLDDELDAAEYLVCEWDWGLRTPQSNPDSAPVAQGRK